MEMHRGWSMPAEPIYIDATDDPSLSRIVTKVRDSKRIHVIRLGGEDAAIIAPVRASRKKRTITEEDRIAFLSSLGGWKDVDTDRLIDGIYTARRVADRPPIEL